MILPAHTGRSLTSQHVKSESIGHHDKDLDLVLLITPPERKVFDNLLEFILKNGNEFYDHNEIMRSIKRAMNHFIKKNVDNEDGCFHHTYRKLAKHCMY